MKTKDKLYYIQKGWIGNSAVWYRPNAEGYTLEIDKAGKFDREFVNKVIENPKVVAWECNHVDKCQLAHKRTIDTGHLNRRYGLTGKRK